MKSSLTSRSLKLLGLATKVGRQELAQTIKGQFSKSLEELSTGRLNTRINQARLIAEHLSQLKGAAMKAGQMLSLDAADFFPPEAIELLSKLQGQATPVAWEIMRSVWLEELGSEKIKEFTSLSETPAASASIGQVHRGVLSEGHAIREVAVKIQYPGIAESIDSDLSILQAVAQSFVTLTGRKMDLNELFEELNVVLKQEADYVRERENMLEFRTLLANDDNFIVPQPVTSLCSRRVLTMSWHNGVSINEWLKKSPPLVDRERIARQILDLYCREFYEWGLVQTDPNYANFLIQENPLKLVLLDFGAVLRYTPDFRREYVEMLKILGTLDRQKIIRSFTDFGLLDYRESDEVKDDFVNFLLISLEPFLPAKQPFRFRNDDFGKRSRDFGRAFAQKLKYSAPPRKVIFLHRKLGGIFTLLKKMDIEISLLPYWEQMTRTVIVPKG